MQDLAATGASSMSCPQTATCPAEGAMKPPIMRMVVDFPAPLAPRNPSTSPGATENVKSSTASLSPYRLDKFFVVIMAALERRSTQEVPQYLGVLNIFLPTGGPQALISRVRPFYR